MVTGTVEFIVIIVDVVFVQVIPGNKVLIVRDVFPPPVDIPSVTGPTLTCITEFGVAVAVWRA